jgi:hypothetical protein
MHGHGIDLADESVNDELDVFRGHPFHGLLDHVVAVLVLEAFHNVAFQLIDKLDLLIRENMFQSLDEESVTNSRLVFNITGLLNNPAAIHLHGKIDNMAFHSVREDLLLILVAMLKELLNHIVPKDILHELHDIRKQFFEDHGLFVAVCRLEFLLDKARTELIATKFHGIPINILWNRSA